MGQLAQEYCNLSRQVADVVRQLQSLRIWGLARIEDYPIELQELCPRPKNERYKALEFSALTKVWIERSVLYVVRASNALLRVAFVASRRDCTLGF